MTVNKRWIKFEMKNVKITRHLCCNCIHRSSQYVISQQMLCMACNTKTRSKDPFTIGTVMKLWTEPRTKPHISRSKLKRGRAVDLITPDLHNRVATAIEKCSPESSAPFWHHPSTPLVFVGYKVSYRKWSSLYCLLWWKRFLSLFETLTVTNVALYRPLVSTASPTCLITWRR